LYNDLDNNSIFKKKTRNDSLSEIILIGAQ